MKDLKEFLKNNQEKEDTVCFDAVDPPCKRIRLEHTEEGPDDLNHNGALRQIPSGNGENNATENSAVKVCNVCLGVLQEFCEADFVKKVTNQYLSFMCTFVGARVCWGLRLKNTMQLNN